jgi:hypothetical protein
MKKGYNGWNTMEEIYNGWYMDKGCNRWKTEEGCNGWNTEVFTTGKAKCGGEGHNGRNMKKGYNGCNNMEDIYNG